MFSDPELLHSGYTVPHCSSAPAPRKDSLISMDIDVDIDGYIDMWLFYVITWGSFI